MNIGKKNEHRLQNALALIIYDAYCIEYGMECAAQCFPTLHDHKMAVVEVLSTAV